MHGKVWPSMPYHSVRHSNPFFAPPKDPGTHDAQFVQFSSECIAPGLWQWSPHPSQKPQLPSLRHHEQFLPRGAQMLSSSASEVKSWNDSTNATTMQSVFNAFQQAIAFGCFLLQNRWNKVYRIVFFLFMSYFPHIAFTVAKPLRMHKPIPVLWCSMLDAHWPKSIWIISLQFLGKL